MPELTEEQQKLMDKYLREKYPHLDWDKKEPKPWKDGDPERRGKKDRRKPAKKSGGFWE